MSEITRPFGVTLIAILMILSAIGALISSVISLFDPELRDGLGLVSLLLIIVTALIYLLLAKGILNGNSFARFIVVIFTVLQLLNGIWRLIAEPGLRLAGAVQIVVSLVILALLFSRKAAYFFSRS
jgi:uncharacterized membrane protein